MKKVIRFFLQQKIFILFNILVLCAKIFYSSLHGFEGLTFEDWSIANNLAKYNVYSEYINLGPTAYKLPLYPILLSIFIKIFGDHAMAAVIIFQHLIYFLIPLLIISISKIFDKLMIGLVTSYLFILSPAYFFYSNTLEITNVFIIIFLNFLFWFLLIWEKGSLSRRSIILAISTTLLFLTQVIAVPFSIVLLFSLLIFKKVKLKQFFFIICTVGILYSPWVIRNYVVFDKLIIAKTPVWQNIHFGYFSEVQIFESLQKIPFEKGEEIKRRRSKTDEFTMEAFYKKEVKELEKNDRYISVRKAFANALMLWYVPSRYFYDNSLSILLGRKLYVIVINIMSILAMIEMYKRRHLFLLIFTLVLFANFTLPYTIGHAAMTRFKLDFEWYQLFLVAYFIYFKTNRNLYLKKTETL
ncbi:glycosyltransferase family protein [Epilithonimonas lactis]|uniref:Uncharacterized protein n=1 Tax=Epilithonimonas lactis TaxID=421072 RepID=A0A085BI28_9FLAO|nr:glycosyltransferase family 39 protein [Epilithonimonas lactis]KFC22123.1 hypothetical protein IO89_09180 [Epilithonimonas lactis]SEQ55164.1 Dolichyl-phosphate-mannose-protein mannosyltransferase [Epilithonimonas lactis]